MHANVVECFQGETFEINQCHNGAMLLGNVLDYGGEACILAVFPIPFNPGALPNAEARFTGQVDNGAKFADFLSSSMERVL